MALRAAASEIFRAKLNFEYFENLLDADLFFPYV